MLMSDAVALLPLDKASIVVPTPDTPEIVLKHVDGELVRIVERADGYAIERRFENAISWFQEGRRQTLEQAVVDAADMQGFPARRGGEPTNIVEFSDTGVVGTDALEIAPLDRGGIVLDRERHLPVVLHTVDGEYWRLRVASREADEHYVLERREDAVANWETVETLEDGLSVGGAVGLFTEYLDVEVVRSPSSGGIETVVEDAGIERGRGGA